MRKYINKNLPGTVMEENRTRTDPMIPMVCVALMVSLSLILPVSLQTFDGQVPELRKAYSLAYTSHPQIVINGDLDFNNASGVVWGSGTETDPYIIDGWEINATGASAAILLGNTTAFFRISDCFVHDADTAGILLSNVRNGTLIDNNCSFSGIGICAKDSSDINVKNNSVILREEYGMGKDNRGVRFENCFNVTVEKNVFVHGQEGVVAVNSSNLEFVNNTFADLLRGVMLNSCSQTKFHHNHFINQTLFFAGEAGPGIGISLSGSHDSEIAFNDFNFSDLTITIGTYENVTIFNNTIKNGGMDAGVSLEDTKNVSIIANSVTKKDVGFAIFNSLYVTISLNNASNNFNNVVMANTVSGLTVSDNIFLDNGVGIALVNVLNATINDNTQTNSTQYSWLSYGIDISSSSNVEVRNNGLTGNICGIYVQSSDNIAIYDNNASDNQDQGIDLEYSNYNTIQNNTCSGNGKDGIHLNDSCSGNYISNNSCSHNGNDGILLGTGMDNDISNNSCSHNAQRGITIFGYSNILRENTCSDNDIGIYLGDNTDEIINNSCSDNHQAGIYLHTADYDNLRNNRMINCGIVIRGPSIDEWATHTIDTSNTVNGKPVRYYADQSGGTVAAGAGQVIIAHCSNMYVQYQNCNNASIGIQIGFSSNIDVSSNDCSYSNSGISLSSSNGNTIFNNSCSANRDYGIFLTASYNNAIQRNLIAKNSQYGLCLDASSSDNRVWNNTFNNNNGSSDVYDSAHVQAFDSGLRNRWNDSSHGNYWSDWTDPDEIPPWLVVDLPYDISGGSFAKDYYPLKRPLPDSIPPIGSISINGGATYTNSISVSLFLSASDNISGVAEMRFRDDNSIWSPWESYSRTRTWHLTSGNGVKKIYAQFKDNASNVATFNATIVLDTISPTITFGVASGHTFNSVSETVNWSGIDVTSGMNHYEYSIDGTSFTDSGLVTQISVGDLSEGAHNLTVRGVDNAGNVVEEKLFFRVSVDDGIPSLFGEWFGIILLLMIVCFIAGMAIPRYLSFKKKSKDETNNEMQKKDREPLR